ncbi:hypothetical protein Dsin_009820 [Dipteronia sinensis]|uniref:RRM domain-containing protein n=1 Tax=Dipteronia sinensis TaxID=43782 RepID=A0AAE0AS90_9ROSI|nr:hypothetical protein Dsin_009820 [Dipteronia sinensis]
MGIFKTFGLVLDVFVSTKSSSRRSRFAFILFASIDEASKVARLTDGLHIVGWPIVAKVATFGWNNRRNGLPNDDSLKGGFATKSYRGIFRSEDKREKSSSFVEVIRGDKHKTVPGLKEDNVDTMEMFWDGSKLEADWLSKCAVGVLKGFDNVSSVNYRLINRGVSFSVSYLGDKFILWKFESEDDCLDFINNRFYWDDCFSLMEKWLFSLIARARPIWINFSVVPLSCWNSEFFMKLGRLIGHPLAIHEGTLLRRRLDIWRLLVLIQFGFRCPSKIKVAGGYKSFILTVEEDTSQVPCFWVEDFLWLKKDYQDISSYEQNTDAGGHEALKGVRHKSTVSKIQISSKNVGRVGSRQPKTRDTVAIKQIGSIVDVGRAMATGQIITKEKKVSKGVGELCISKNALGGRCSGRKAVNVDKGLILSLTGATLNFDLLRGGIA